MLGGKAQLYIGKYMQITMIKNNRVYCRYLGEMDEFLISPSILKRCAIMHIAYLAVEKKEYMKICTYCTSTQHICNRQYDSFIAEYQANGVEVVCFYNRRRKVYCTIDNIKKIAIRKNYMTIPCVKIYLKSIIAKEDNE